MTNEEKIKNMTTYELASLLKNPPLCVGMCDDFEYGCAYKCPHNNGVDIIEKWLKRSID